MEEAILCTKELTKRYGRELAVDHLTLELQPGSITALLGRNGAGKTTLLKLLLGLELADVGTSRLFGLDPVRDTIKLRQQVGYVRDRHDFYPWMRLNQLGRYTGAFYPTWDSTCYHQLLERFDLSAQQKVKTLSTGMRAKLALALALAHRPRLILLDEPTSGLDPVIRREFFESILTEAAETGTTILIASHLIVDLERIVDSVIFLRQGKLVLHEPLENLHTQLCQIQVTFTETPPVDLDLPGLLDVRKAPREWLLTFRQAAPDLLSRLRQRWPTATLSPRRLSLEDTFIALFGND